MSADENVDETPKRPLLRVVKGDPTPEELAALVAVLASRGGAAPAPEPARSAWSRPGHNLRRPLAIGPLAWRESGFHSGVRTHASW